MILKRKTCELWRKVGSIAVVSLLFFAGIANAYCNVDKFPAPVGPRAVSLAAAYDVSDPPAGVSDAGCDTAVMLDQQNGQSSAEWWALAHVSGALLHVLPASRPAHVAALSLTPIPEPVFRRFPRLLI